MEGAPLTELESLLEHVAEIHARLARSGVECVLVGGLAVHLRKASLVSSGSMSDPASLAAVFRTTQDIDLVVLGEAAAEAPRILREIDFERTSPGSVRFRAADATVDILQGVWAEAGAPLVEELPQSLTFHLAHEDVTPVTVAKESLAVPTIAALVVVKAMAMVAPARGKRGSDMADIASLALAELARPTGARDDLERWAPKMPDSGRRALEEVHSRFASEHADGSRAFAAHVRSAQRGLGDDDDVIAALASDAVRQLLRSFRPQR